MLRAYLNVGFGKRSLEDDRAVACYGEVLDAPLQCLTVVEEPHYGYLGRVIKEKE
jgi:hypothetical protein